MMAGARDPPGKGWTTPAAAASTARLGDAAAHQPPQQQQPHRPAAATTTSPPAGLLIVDMPHLRQGLERYFPQLVAPQGGGVAADGALPLDSDAGESLAVLLPSVVSSLEAAYGTRFTKRCVVVCGFVCI